MMSEQEPGVPLSHYRQHQAGVMLCCGGCENVRILELEAVIDGLKARGLGDEATGIRAVSRFMTQPCSCGARRWTSQPAWRPARSSHVE